MRLGLYVPRRSSFTVMSPVLAEAQRRHWEVVLVRDPAVAKPDDAWEGAALPCPSAFRGDWFLACPPVPTPGAGRRVALEAWWDSFMHPVDPQGIAVMHRTMRDGLLPTDGSLDGSMRPTRRDALLWFPPKTRIPGWPAIWHRAVIVMFAPALARAARRWGWRFVIKTRGKITLPFWAYALADEVVSDGIAWPSLSLQALSRAALAVTHQSAAGAEAVAVGTRAWSIRGALGHLAGAPQAGLMRARWGTPFAWPGLIDPFRWDHALRRLAARQPPVMTVDATMRRRFEMTWCGDRFTGASAALLDRLC